LRRTQAFGDSSFPHLSHRLSEIPRFLTFRGSSELACDPVSKLLCSRTPAGFRTPPQHDEESGAVALNCGDGVTPTVGSPIGKEADWSFWNTGGV
jgi:hypothetical protein